MHSAYNFVPQADKAKLLTKAEADRLSQDIPFEDGLCGEIELTLTNDTPLLVGTGLNSQQQALPYQSADGKSAIPGSSLRGAIRSVLEIVTRSRLDTFVDDSRPAIRDLAGPLRELYSGKMAYVDKKRFKELPIYHSSVKAGWLRFAKCDNEQQEKWNLYPCFVARVEQSKIRDAFPNFLIPTGNNEKLSAKKKYERLGAAPKEVFSKVVKRGIVYSANLRAYLAQGIVTELNTHAKEGNEPGHLIFTAQLGTRKHREFFFYGTSDSPISLAERAVHDLIEIYSHAPSPQFSPEWDYYKKWAFSTPGIPVFYLQEKADEPVADLGLVQMFKLRAKHRLHSAIKQRHLPEPDEKSSDHDELALSEIDSAQAMFGDAACTIKSRLSFGELRCENTIGKVQPVNAILSSPKTSFFPNYMAQPNSVNGYLRPGAKYETLLNDSVPELSGWKRYPVRDVAQVVVAAINPQQAANQQIQTQLNPLAADNRFKGFIRFHNLREKELGALIWALSWGGNENLRHTLGGGKPFGYGSCKIEIIGIKASRNDDSSPQQKYHQFSTTELLKRFSEAESVWLSEIPVKTLLKMADPTYKNANSSWLKPISSEPRDFQKAKNEKRSLSEY